MYHSHPNLRKIASAPLLVLMALAGLILCAVAARADEPAVSSAQWGLASQYLKIGATLAPGSKTSRVGAKCEGRSLSSTLPLYDSEGKTQLGAILLPMERFVIVQSILVSKQPFKVAPEPATADFKASPDAVRVTEIINPAGGRKLYEITVGNGPVPIVSGKGGPIAEGTYAGDGKVAGIWVDGKIFNSTHILHIESKLGLPLLTYSIASGAHFEAGLSQSTVLHNGPGGTHYLISAGAGAGFVIPTGANSPSSYHLDFEAAPAVTNIGPRVLSPVLGTKLTLIY